MAPGKVKDKICRIECIIQDCMNLKLCIFFFYTFVDDDVGNEEFRILINDLGVLPSIDVL